MSGDRVLRTLAHATLLVIAPSAPVAWSPGSAPLSESLRARIRAGAGSMADRAVATLPGSGRRVVGVAVRGEAQRPTSIAPAGPVAGTPSARSTPLGQGSPSGLGRPVPVAHAPWREADPVPGVVVRTSLVHGSWLRRPSATQPTEGRGASGQTTHLHVHHPSSQRDPVPVPTSGRIRRAAMMAFGLVVSLVAVEAAARVGRR